MAVADYLASGKLREPGQFLTRTSEIAESARLPIIGSFPSGFFIAVILGVFIWWILGRTTSGFRIETVGRNRHAAWYAGISVKRTVISAMIVSGAIAGLGGAVHVLGTEHALTAGVAGSFGFDAITVALLGQATPIGTVFGAFLFGALQTGGRTLLSNTGTSPDIVQVIQALIVLFIAAPALMKSIFRIKKSFADKSMTAKSWNG